MYNKHGLTHIFGYQQYINIIGRCCNIDHKSYKNYGGRGITIYKDWIDNPKAFIEYIKTLENYNIKNYSLDRENNNGNYEPGNLRFTTRHIQQSNRNIQSNNKTGHSGISIHKNKYQSYIKINNKLKYLGYFDSIEKAIECRNNYITENKLTEYN